MSRAHPQRDRRRPLVGEPRARSRPRAVTARSLFAGLVCLVMVAMAGVGVQGGAAAHADTTGAGWRISSYDLKAVVDRDGDASVVLNLAFDFGDHGGHGPYLTFTRRQGLVDDPDHWRMIDYSDVSVESATRAPTDTRTTETAETMLIRIGSESRVVTGVQKYRISYTVHGLIKRSDPVSGKDEVDWQVLDDFDVPIGSTTVMVSGPGPVQKAFCFNDFRSCSASRPGGKARFDAGPVQAGRPLRVGAAFQAGTFSAAADARLSTRTHPQTSGSAPSAHRRGWGEAMALKVGSAVGMAVASLVGALLVVGMWRRGSDGRDGPATPSEPGPEKAAQRARAAPAAEVCRPPVDVSPAEAGLLMDGRAGIEDVTAAILDLAVRGHIRIRPITLASQKHRRTPPSDWSLDLRKKPDDGLRAWELELLANFIGPGGSTSAQLIEQSYGNRALSGARRDLDQAVVANGWYSRSPRLERRLSAFVGLGVLAVGALIAVLAGAAGLGLVGVPVMVAGVLMAILGLVRPPGRTASGAAVLDQIEGFRRYLATLDADQIRLQKNVDVLSRYLPWAVTLGLSNRWIALVGELGASGGYKGSFTWCGGLHALDKSYDTGSSGGLVRAMDDMTSAVASSLRLGSRSAIFRYVPIGLAAGGYHGSGGGGGGGFGGGGGGGW